MKNSFVILIIILFFTGCSNIFVTDSNVNFSTTLHSLSDNDSRAVTVPIVSSLTKMQLWISDANVNYWLLEPADYIEGSDIVIPEEGTDVNELPTIRYVETENSTMDVTVQTNINRVFTLRVEFLHEGIERIFLGTIERAIIPGQTTIPIDLYETESSKDNVQFYELNEFLEGDGWNGL